jgi:spore coat protein U-like protein
MFKRFGTLAAALLLASGAALAPAFAATNSHSASLSVGATTVSNCQAITSSSVAFSSSYDPFTFASTPDKDSGPATFSTHCTLGDSINWTVNAGGNCGKGLTGTTDRAMVDGSSHYLSYQLFQDSGYGTQWVAPCTGAATAVSQTGAGAGTANSISVYAEIPAGQDAFVGSNNTDSYSDTVSVTVNY